MLSQGLKVTIRHVIAVFAILSVDAVLCLIFFLDFFFSIIFRFCHIHVQPFRIVVHPVISFIEAIETKVHYNMFYVPKR